MTRRTILLGHDDLWHMFPLIDAVEQVAATLTRRASGHATGETPCRIVLAPGQTPGGEELALIENLRIGTRCLSPTSGLYALRTAATVVLAARALLVPGVVTAAVIGAAPAVHPHLAVIARQVPGVSHLALCTTGDPTAAQVGTDVLDALDRAGIRTLVTTTAAEAVFGANLVVLTGPDLECPRLNELALGAVLVNASGRDLPRRLVRGVDGIYVDNVELLARNTHRELVRTHLTRSAAPAGRSAGWHRGQIPRGQRRVDADLGQVLAGRRPGRRHVDDVLLVELLGTRELDVELACRIHQLALVHGLGTALSD